MVICPMMLIDRWPIWPVPAVSVEQHQQGASEEQENGQNPKQVRCVLRDQVKAADRQEGEEDDPVT